MLLPQIHTCLVCEEARKEVLGKWTLLGFFGVAPNVHVAIADFAKPVALCFAFVGGEAVGKLRVAIRVMAPSGADVPGGSEVEGEFLPGKLTTALFMSFLGIVPGPGRCTVVLVVNDQGIYRTTFELVQGDAADMLKQLQP
jgi:hypothetical protein